LSLMDLLSAACIKRITSYVLLYAYLARDQQGEIGKTPRVAKRFTDCRSRQTRKQKIRPAITNREARCGMAYRVEDKLSSMIHKLSCYLHNKEPANAS